ncbi:hypothetical protein HGRIS_007115 [Hohenbuehelia grisea]|uniref:Uncharacterized protein n=1 Tax=Hohenbuehelia grisea TaxID=104357 RepID=A0ABR3JBF3_9AGAR
MDLSSSSYASHRKELLTILNQLRAVGAQNDLDLPRITVIGNQSAGKSSLIEAISGIHVPREAGTCTRCPIECRLASSSGPWRCQISIRLEYDANHGRLNDISEAKFGETITDKTLVEGVIRQAQFAVLNPQLSFEDVLKMEPDELETNDSSLSFSQNVICVDLEGPELTDLSFVDLPGIIHTGNPRHVSLVKQLVGSYIKGNSLILVVIPMTDEMDNQEALTFAREADPQGRRTIGVLTKPDMLTEGAIKAREHYMDVLAGHRHPLSHGYFCVRLPDDAQRMRIAEPKESREAESAFFTETEPWSRAATARLGVEKLVACLGKLLVQIVDQSLPGIRAEANKMLATCKRQLAGLPKELDMDPTTYTTTLLTEFCTEIKQFVRAGGERDFCVLIQANRESYANFKEAIFRTRPRFIPESNTLQGVPDRFADVLLQTEQSIYLEDMRSYLAQSISRELPKNIPFQAKATLISAFQNNWPSAAIECFNEVQEATTAILLMTLGRHFDQYVALKEELSTFLLELVEKHHIRCLMFVETALEVELTPYTQNTHYLESSSSKWLARYKDSRAGKFNSTPNQEALSGEAAEATNPAPAQADGAAGGPSSIPAPVVPTDAQINLVLAALAQIGYHGLEPEDLGKLNPPDEFDTELTVMSEVRGYFQVAYKRIIDTIPGIIDLRFVKAIAEDIQTFLIRKLALGTEEAAARCKAYLAEDPAVVAQRDELTGRVKRLETVIATLKQGGL